MIEREDFISLQEKITTDNSQYIYGFKYFYQYPFISFNQIVYLPLPHLVMQSVTSSLLFRLTEGKNVLRNLFGKEVLEKYVVHICSLSKSYDEVVSDFPYKYKGSEKRTLDVMIRKGNQCLLLDSKSMSPRTSLRDLTENDMEYTINRLVASVIQVYQHITDRYQIEYYPFKMEIDFLKENIFGAVILFEDSFVRREVIMRRVADRLNIDYESEEYKYLCSNIKLFSLYEVERIVFTQEDIFWLLTKNREEKNKWFDYTLSKDSTESAKSVINEINHISDEVKDILNEFALEIERQVFN